MRTRLLSTTVVIAGLLSLIAASPGAVSSVVTHQPRAAEPHLVLQVGHAGYVTAISLSPDGRFVLTGSYDGTAKLWEAASGREIRRFVGHGAMIYTAAWLADGKHIATVSLDATARLWNRETGEEVRRLTGGAGEAFHLSADGQFVLSSAGRFLDFAAGKEVRRYPLPIVGYSVAFSPDGEFVRPALTSAARRGNHINLPWSCGRRRRASRSGPSAVTRRRSRHSPSAATGGSS